jgi:hypothetical protein
MAGSTNKVILIGNLGAEPNISPDEGLAAYCQYACGDLRDLEG